MVVQLPLFAGLAAEGASAVAGSALPLVLDAVRPPDEPSDSAEEGVRYPAAYTQAAPVLKWAGGKRWLVRDHGHLLPRRFNNYFEPFLGGAALYLGLWNRRRFREGARAFLSDANGELINFYQVVRDAVGNLIAELAGREYANTRDAYYLLRRSRPTDPVKRAARTRALNAMCYNGLYRMNSGGGFNVPYGDYSRPNVCDGHALRAASAALQGASLMAMDFASAAGMAERGDFVYFDPPYVPMSPTASFTNYTGNGFSDLDQLRVRDAFENLCLRGAMVMLSNSDVPAVRKAYEGHRIEQVLARRSISSKSLRRPVPELVVMNY
jgi:DNA adenine methylase